MAASLFLSPALADGMPTRGRVATPPQQPEARRCTLSANVALASEYVFRGFSQTSEGAAIQGGFDATCGLFYAGAWASNLDWGPVTNFDGTTVSTWASIEVDLYAGLKGKHGRFGWDLGAIWYTYPNSTQNPFGTPFDDFRNEYVELKAGASTELWKDGTLGVTGFYSPDYQYETGTVWTLEVGFAQAFPAYWGFTPTISALYGHQWGNDAGYAARVAGEDEYSYWNAGVTLGFLEKWAVDLRYWDTDLDDDGFCSGRYFQCDERFVASLKFTY
jgi:uncharacterized protein (TIGR02001 family)